MPKNTKKQFKVRKAMVLAAGWGTRFLPLTKVVHKELIPILNKPIIHYLAEEAVASGIEEIVLVISPRKFEILKYFSHDVDLEKELRLKGKTSLLRTVLATDTLVKVTVAIQNEQLGLGHAILTGADAIGNEPFALILGDDLIDAKEPVLKQLIDVFYQTDSTVIGVQSVAKSDIHKYGIVKPELASAVKSGLFKIAGAVEKPEPVNAPSDKAILGRYIFKPTIFDALRKVKTSGQQELDVVDAFAYLIPHEPVYAYEFSGKRYDLGSIEGFVKANIDFALRDPLIGNKIKDHLSAILQKKKA